MALALIPVVLRFWLRFKETHPHSLNRDLSDGLVLFSWLSGMVLVGINTWKNSLRQRYIGGAPPGEELNYGVPHSISANLLYVSWISLFFIYISLWAAKFSLLAFYGSIRGQLPTGDWVADTVLLFASSFTAATFALHMILLAKWCSPVSSNWDVEGHLCSAVHDIKSVSISTAANIATDLAILALPLMQLTSILRARRSLLSTVRRPGGINRAELGGIALVLCMAALSITAALARWATLEVVQHVPKANITHTIDVWALVEIVASLLAVCLPGLRAFVRKTKGRGSGRRLRPEEGRGHSGMEDSFTLQACGKERGPSVESVGKTSQAPQAQAGDLV